MSLPKFKSDDQSLSLMQTAWATELDPVLRNPLTSGNLLKSVELVTGSNSVNHKLGRKLQGWLVIRKRAISEIYDAQDTCPTPALTLQLVSSANVTVDLYCF